MSSLLAAGLALGIVVLRRRQALPRSSMWLVLWPVAVCCMYAMVHVESRFFGGFLVIFWLTFARLFPAKWQVPRLAFAMVSAVLLLASIRNTQKDTEAIAQAANTRIVAARLKSVGVQPGDRIAVVGDGLYAFYARVAGARIVAEISGQKRVLERRLCACGSGATGAERRWDQAARGRGQALGLSLRGLAERCRRRIPRLSYVDSRQTFDPGGKSFPCQPLKCKLALSGTNRSIHGYNSQFFLENLA